jgi:hypothetical protein
LIYFIFRVDTYVVSSVFICLMIIGGLTAGVRILLEKGPSRHHISEDQHFQENTQKFKYYRKTKVARRRERKEQQGGHTTRWHGPALGCATQWCGHPGPLLPSPPRVYCHPQKPKIGGGSEIDYAASAGQNTQRERKFSGRQKSAREMPSRRVEIVAIIVAIELDFIGIIIIIITITSTFIITMTTPSRYNILGGILSNS